MKGLRITLLVIGIIIIVCAVILAVYIYHNLHWYDKYEKAIKKVHVVEKQVELPDGEVINYGEVENDKPALLLIHGQGGVWQDYALTMPELSKNWHIYAIDVYGHGKSSQDAEYYYLDKNADDLIWFINNVICEETVVSGHSNGAITAAYLAAYGGGNVVGAVLEDPPVFSIEGENWEKHFSYLDSFKLIHEYRLSDKSECWEAYYLRNCYWGKLFMDGKTAGLADSAQKYHEKHPDEYVKIPYMPSSIWYTFKFNAQFDQAYAENFFDCSWNNGHAHKDILEAIEIPCVYLHAKEGFGPNGEMLCAASLEQAERAISYIGDNCTMVETPTSDHTIHTKYTEIYIDAVNSLKERIKNVK